MSHSKILNIILALTLLCLTLTMNFNKKETTVLPSSKEGESTRVYNQSTTHQARVWLTVAEGKRLIAKGLAIYPPVVEKMHNGSVVVTKGTTNTYVAEELLQDTLSNGEFVYGHILPANGVKKLDRSQNRNELVFVDGQVVDKPYVDMLGKMKSGDIVIKGANMVNHAKQQAGVLIGHPTGGTIGNVDPFLKSNKLRLIIPVGLEKETSQDIDFISQFSKLSQEEVNKKTPYLWSMKGEIFTEIEAIKQFADVEVFQIGAGGIGGAEGAVTLCIRGDKDEVEKALGIVESIQGEEPFL